ncbi:hypothetical protein OKW28_004863 [Paraburkholderia sp. 40]
MRQQARGTRSNGVANRNNRRAPPSCSERSRAMFILNSWSTRPSRASRGPSRKDARGLHSRSRSDWRRPAFTSGVASDDAGVVVQSVSDNPPDASTALVIAMNRQRAFSSQGKALTWETGSVSGRRCGMHTTLNALTVRAAREFLTDGRRERDDSRSRAAGGTVSVCLKNAGGGSRTHVRRATWLRDCPFGNGLETVTDGALRSRSHRINSPNCDACEPACGEHVIFS